MIFTLNSNPPPSQIHNTLSHLILLQDTDSETSGVEDSDDEEIFNLSQTDLFHKIKDKHNVDIKTKVR